MRLIAPALPEKLDAALAGVRHVLVVEQNHGAQFYRYLRALFDLPGRPRASTARARCRSSPPSSPTRIRRLAPARSPEPPGPA